MTGLGHLERAEGQRPGVALVPVPLNAPAADHRRHGDGQCDEKNVEDP